MDVRVTVELVRDTCTPRPGGPLPRLEQPQQLSHAVATIESQRGIIALEPSIAGGGSPLGRAKPKELFDIDGESRDMKFFNNERVDTLLIEHATMTLAQKAGIHLALTQVIALAGANGVAVRGECRSPMPVGFFLPR
jgi:serine/threonine-protein kinase HipA